MIHTQGTHIPNWDLPVQTTATNRAVRRNLLLGARRLGENYWAFRRMGDRSISRDCKSNRDQYRRDAEEIRGYRGVA